MKIHWVHVNKQYKALWKYVIQRPHKTEHSGLLRHLCKNIRLPHYLLIG